jgi:hypothetical protein
MQISLIPQCENYSYQYKYLVFLKTQRNQTLKIPYYEIISVLYVIGSTVIFVV